MFNNLSQQKIADVVTEGLFALSLVLVIIFCL